MNSSLLKYFSVLFLLLTVVIGCERNATENAGSRSDEKGAASLLPPEDRWKMPDLTLPSVQDGVLVSSKDFQGKVKLVVFFTPWCSSCVTEIAMLQDFLEDYTDRFSVIGMAVVSKDSEGRLEQFIKKLGLEFPILVSDDAVQKGFGGIITVPTAFLIDKKGNIARKFVNHLEKDHLTASVDMLLQES